MTHRSILWELRGKHGGKAMTRVWDTVLKGVVIGLIAWVLVFCVHLIWEPYHILADTQANLDKVIREKARLTGEKFTLTRRIADLERNPITRIVQPEKQCWLDNHFGFPNSRVEGAVSATAAIIHCNYRIEAPYAVDVEFDRDILRGPMVVPGAGTVLGRGEVVRGRIQSSGVDSPSLPANQLIIMTVFGPTDVYPRALRASVKTIN